jgi:hypothetical protein
MLKNADPCGDVLLDEALKHIKVPVHDPSIGNETKNLCADLDSIVKIASTGSVS